MKIAIVYPSLRAVGGAENVVIWLAESLAERGHHVSLFTREFSEEVWGTIRERPYSVCLLDFKKQRSTLKTNRAAGAALSKALKLSLNEFNVINPHNYPASLWVYYAKRQGQCFPKVLLFLHNLTRNFYEDIIDIHYRKLPGLMNLWERYRPKKLLRRLRQILFGYRKLDKAAVLSADKVLANSFYTAELAQSIYGINVQACPLGVSLKSFDLTSISKTSDQSDNGNQIMMLTVARIERQKNFDTILNALNKLKKMGSLPNGFQYKVAGNGPLLNYFRNKSHRMGLDIIVEFLGHVPHADLPKLYKESSFLLHIPLDEPFGLVPLEAALFKKPSIVSDHGGPVEIVHDGLTGLHTSALDADVVSEKILIFLREPDTVRKMGDFAHSRVLTEMTFDIFVERFVTSMQHTLALN